MNAMRVLEALPVILLASSLVFLPLLSDGPPKPPERR
jgi:hypothetical protein